MLKVCISYSDDVQCFVYDVAKVEYNSHEGNNVRDSLKIYREDGHVVEIMKYMMKGFSVVECEDNEEDKKLTVMDNTLDKVIENERKLAKENFSQGMLCHANPDDGKLETYVRKGKYHENLVDMLEELKELREFKEKVESETWDKIYQSETIIRNKAIDDFAKALQEKIEKDLSNSDLALECKKCGIWKNYDIAEIAEQLKAGGIDV